MANPFKEAELRKQEEAKRLAEEAKKREAEEAKKREAEAQTQAETEPVKTETINEPAVEQEEAKTPVVQEPAPVVEAAPEAPAAVPEVENQEEKDLATALREQVDADMDKMERKVAINIMVPPSLKRKMERDIRNKKFRSMSYLITALLKEYYK